MAASFDREKLLEALDEIGRAADRGEGTRCISRSMAAPR